jgi:hypothetical protein
MLKPYSALRRFVTARLTPPLLVLWDLATHLARIVPDASDRVRFRRFWGDGSLLTDVRFVTDSYAGVTLRNRFRFQEAMLGRGVLETLAGNTIVDGAFAPQAAAMLTVLFLRHAGNVLRVVTDAEASAGPGASLICYGTSDSNCKTFDIEARSGSSLCRFLMDANGQRAFRLAEQVFSMESRGGVIYDKAIVLRLTNREDSAHCHVVCAGLSEWGSLAAVYYLTTKWKELHKRYDGFGQRRDFCVLLEVPCGQVENVREVLSAACWEPESVPDPVLVSSHV